MTKYIYHKQKKIFVKLPTYIYQRKNGWFEIRKRIGGVLIYWGSFPTLEEAMLFKAYYIGKHWKVSPKFKLNKHIIKRNNHYMVLKEVEGEMVSFGTFDNIEDARHERDICVSCDWDFDRIVEWVD